MAGRFDVDEVARDLTECRQRGPDRLDVQTTTRKPVQAAALQRLAQDYGAARGLPSAGRVTLIKALLRDGIDELARQGSSADAGLLRDLFFGDSPDDGPIRAIPGELLRTAQRKAGEPSESRFRERRAAVLRFFAGFLINLVTQSPAGATSAIPAQTQHSDSGSIIRFFDRAAELEEMARSLASSPLVILRGVGGVGKTLLATVYADRHKSDYQMVLLVPASQPASIASQFSAFLAESGGRPASRRSVVASGTICSSWRRRLPITTSVRTRSSRLMSVVPSQQWCRATIQSSSR